MDTLADNAGKSLQFGLFLTPEVIVFAKFWNNLRLALLGVVFVFLGVYLFATTPWARLFYGKPNYKSEIAEGSPLVAAVYRFKAATNLWPEYLEDAAPNAPAKWYYTVAPDGPSLATSPEMHVHVGYNFDPLRPEWRIIDNDGVRTVHSDETNPATHVTSPPREQLVAEELAELTRRITREPRLIEHREHKAAFLLSVHRDADAKAEITIAAKDFPDHFWPPLAESALAGTSEPFATWNTGHPAFTHSYYLSLLHRRQNNPSAAIAAVTDALTHPVELTADDPDILSFYLWDMTRYALERKKYDLVLQLTDAWQKLSTARQLHEDSYLPLRAAANLALKKEAAARSDLTLLDSLKTRTWARNIAILQSAIDSDDRTFTYDPGPTPEAFNIFPLPQ